MSKITTANGLLFFGDQHQSAEPVGRRLAGYANAVFKKISDGIEIANQNNYVPLFAGDLFDSPVETEEWVKTELQERFAKSNIKIIANTGNHDISGSILSKSDSLALIAAGRVIDVISRPMVPGDARVFLIDGHRVGVIAVPYGNPIPNDVTAFKTKQNLDNILILTHHDLGFEGAYPGAAEPFEIAGCDIVMNGHMHTHRDPVMFGSTMWYNPGSLTRTSIDCAKEKPSVFAVQINPETGKLDKLTRYELEHQPFEKCFDLTGRHVEAAKITSEDIHREIEAKHRAKTFEINRDEFATAFRADLMSAKSKTASGEVMRDRVLQYLKDFKAKPLVHAEVQGLLAEVIGKESPEQASRFIQDLLASNKMKQSSAQRLDEDIEGQDLFEEPDIDEPIPDFIDAPPADYDDLPTNYGDDFGMH